MVYARNDPRRRRASDGPPLARSEPAMTWLSSASPCVTIGAPEIQIQHADGDPAFFQALVAPTADWTILAEPTTRDQGL